MWDSREMALRINATYNSRKEIDDKNRGSRQWLVEVHRRKSHRENTTRITSSKYNEKVWLLCGWGATAETCDNKKGIQS